MSEIILQDTLTDSTNLAKVKTWEWPQLTEKQILEILASLELEDSSKVAGFINGGKLHAKNEKGELIAKNHTMAEPYRWTVAHNVRPASQSLGIHGCKECHSLNSPFLFGKVNVRSLLPKEKPVNKSMTHFQKLGYIYPGLFALSFLLRPWLKVLMLFCIIIVFIVLLLFLFKSFDRILKTVSAKDW